MPVNGASADGAWASNATLAEIAAFLRSCRSVAVITHQKPDGDAVGSSLAVARALNAAAGRQVAMPWFSGPLPDWFGDVVGGTAVGTVDMATTHLMGEPSGICVLDTGTWSQLQEVEAWLRERTDLACVIDHHRQGDADTAARRIVAVEAAAVCEPVAELCRMILGLPSVAKLPTPVAEALYLGLATDTGWFRHSNVSPSAMRLAADLLEAGVDHPRLFEVVEQRDRPSRLRLAARALSSLELLDQDQVALMTLTQQDFHDAHAAPTDTTGFAMTALSVGPVRVAVVLTEAYVEPGSAPLTKVSLRSKAGNGSVNVSRVAEVLGGGGHVHAAGVKVHAPLGEARERVMAALRAEMGRQ